MDLNGNGNQDLPRETGLADWIIFADTDSDGIIDGIEYVTCLDPLDDDSDDDESPDDKKPAAAAVAAVGALAISLRRRSCRPGACGRSRRRPTLRLPPSPPQSLFVTFCNHDEGWIQKRMSEPLERAANPAVGQVGFTCSDPPTVALCGKVNVMQG